MKKKKQEPDYEIELEEDDGAVLSKIKKIKAKLKIAEHERKEYLDGWQRERADFANFKRDMQKYSEESRTLVKEDIASQFLTVLDNIELTLKHAPKEITASDWYRGLDQVHKQYVATFQEIGVQEIEVKEGDVFDPHFHEAVEGEGDKISEVIQKGYMIGAKVLRPVKVKVNKK